MADFPDRYDPSKESDLYSKWEQSGAFKPSGTGKPFSILMPPPNANGSMHVGNAVAPVIQDLMIRYHRMKGRSALWFPGLDHAGFETQVVFEKVLEKQGLSRFTMERDEFYRRTDEFTKENAPRILNQFKRLGASADWDRLYYTLDDDIVTQVYDTFVTLYQDELVYRDKRPVNWCSKHQTTLSDLETNDEERTEPLYYLKYGPLVVATGRPETIFADVAVAVNPTDERYQHLVGTEIDVNMGVETRKLPVIADEYADKEFGTGAVKITPAHDANDFEVAKRHNLPLDLETIDQYGKLTEKAGKYAGLKVAEARTAVAEHLQELGLIEKINEKYTHTVKVCYKCKRTIEPRVLTQWFMAMNKPGTNSGKNLTAMALKAVETGDVRFVTDKFRKIFNHWLTNIYDWAISRQIAWGIQLPVWYCQSANDCPPVVSNPLKSGDPTTCTTCGGSDLVRDSDVFDTWVSSPQLPVLVPNRERFKDTDRAFYPTSVMETGWDILFFWVARMIMFGMYLEDKVPFRDVYLHGLVRDKDSQKMSKSKNNVIDPLAVIDEYGADALRMALVFGTAAGNDMPMGDEKIRGMRNFSTKVWNIGRFVLTNQDGEVTTKPVAKTEADTQLVEKLEETKQSVTKNIEIYNFNEAAQSIYSFLWDYYAAVYLEASKQQLQDESLAANTRGLLLQSLKESITLLHPFMPFVTEAIWQHLPKAQGDSQLLITQSWPIR